MADLTRRDAVIFGVGALAATALPTVRPIAADWTRVPPTPDQIATFEVVKSAVAKFTPEYVEKFFAQAEYGQIFKKTTLDEIGDEIIATQRTVNTGGGNSVTLVSSGSSSARDAQRFDYALTAKEVALGFAICTPEKAAENANLMMLRLIDSIWQFREIRAAEVINHALKYDPSVGGDGQPLFSTRHPHDGGVWSNMLEKHAPLTAENLLEGYIQAVVYAPNRDLAFQEAKARRLVVPHSLEPVASTLSASRAMVWHYLSDPESWFLITGMPGLAMVEEEPLRFEVTMDPDTHNTFVVGKEKVAFGCYDPRAIFGSVKPGLRRNWSEEVRQTYGSDA